MLIHRRSRGVDEFTVMLIALWIISVTFRATWWLLTTPRLGCVLTFECWRIIKGPGADGALTGGPGTFSKQLPDGPTSRRPGSLICAAFWTVVWWNDLRGSPWWISRSLLLQQLLFLEDIQGTSVLDHRLWYRAEKPVNKHNVTVSVMQTQWIYLVSSVWSHVKKK